MGSKRFKGKLCAYCCIKEALTGDHIFAREFFLKEHRGDLPQAPACEECNNAKSKLEHYLTATLPFAGRHEFSDKNFTEHVPKRLNKNQKLHRHLSQNKFEATLVDGGNKIKTLGLPLEEGSVESLFEFIVKGLAWYHWKVYLSFDSPVEIIILTRAGQEFFQEHLFSLHAKTRELINLGEGTVIYEGVQGVDCPEITLWRFHMYGGMLLGDSGGLSSTEIGAMSGPARIMGKGV